MMNSSASYGNTFRYLILGITSPLVISSTCESWYFSKTFENNCKLHHISWNCVIRYAMNIFMYLNNSNPYKLICICWFWHNTNNNTTESNTQWELKIIWKAQILGSEDPGVWFLQSYTSVLWLATPCRSRNKDWLHSKSKTWSGVHTLKVTLYCIWSST